MKTDDSPRVRARVWPDNRNRHHPSPPSPPCSLDALADRLSRLRPDWRDLTEFYAERSHLAAELRRLAAAGRAVR